MSECVLCPSTVEHRARWPIQPPSTQTQSIPQQQLPATSTWPSTPMDSLSLLARLLLVPGVIQDLTRKRNAVPPDRKRTDCKAQSSRVGKTKSPGCFLSSARGSWRPHPDLVPRRPRPSASFACSGGTSAEATARTQFEVFRQPGPAHRIVTSRPHAAVPWPLSGRSRAVKVRSQG